MFSCRPRVELVAAGSRSRCVSIGGTQVSLRGAVDSPPQSQGPRPLKGLTWTSLTASGPMSSAYLNFFCL